MNVSSVHELWCARQRAGFLDPNPCARVGGTDEFNEEPGRTLVDLLGLAIASCLKRTQIFYSRIGIRLSENILNSVFHIQK